MKRFKPMVDRLYLFLFLPIFVLLVALTILACFSVGVLFVIIPVDLVIIYFFVSPLFGYVELREDTLFIRYGFILKKEIPYNKIRGASRERSFYSESMMSLKCAFWHINIKYNAFDVTTVSVLENDELCEEINKRILN